MKHFIKEGWQLNPNPKVVAGIEKGIERCGGECPCHNVYAGTPDAICPCKAYREEDYCCCGLYVKIETEAKLSQEEMEEVIGQDLKIKREDE